MNDSKRLTPARARRHDREPRIHRILLLMATGEWFAGTSHVELAREYGVGVSAIEKDAADASRALRVLEGLDVDAIRNQIFLGLERARFMADEQKDPRALIASLEAQARLLGVQASAKVDVEIRQLQQLPKAELLKQLRADMNYLAETIRALEDQDGSHELSS